MDSSSSSSVDSRINLGFLGGPAFRRGMSSSSAIASTEACQLGFLEDWADTVVSRFEVLAASRVNDSSFHRLIASGDILSLSRSLGFVVCFRLAGRPVSRSVGLKGAMS